MTVQPNITAENSVAYPEDQEVRDIIGHDLLADLDSRIDYIRRLEGIASSPDPFKRQRAGTEPEYLEPKQAQQIGEFLAAEIPTRFAMVSSKAYVRLHRRLEKSIGYTTMASNSYKDTIGVIGDDLTELRITERYKTLTEDDKHLYETSSPILTALTEDAQKLQELAARLPAKDADHVIHQLVAKSKEILKREQLLSSSNRFVSTAAFKALYAKGYEGTTAQLAAQLQRLKRIDRFAQSTRNLGSSYFKAVTSTARYVEECQLIALVDDLHVKKITIQDEQKSNEPAPASALEAEAFLQELIGSAVQRLKQLHPEFSQNPDFKRMTQIILAAEMADKSKADKERREQELSRDLSMAVTEARNILIGGNRLASKKNGMAPKIEALQNMALASDGAKTFSTEQVGIMTAIVLRKFESFLATVEKVQSTEPNEARAVVERDRPEPIAILRRFDRATSLQGLRELLLNEAALSQVSQIFGRENATRIVIALEQTTEQDELETADVLPTDEDPLTAEELYAQLDWTVLPKGEAELEKVAREIVAESGTGAVIDLERLSILKDIKHMWGADRCYYARGQLKRAKAENQGDDRPGDYIVLVLQSMDSAGDITEHAIAESPIAGHNALYITRPDVSAGMTWRDIFSLPKSHAIELGARAVTHRAISNETLVESMKQKVMDLLICTPEEFETMEFNGKRRRFRKLLGSLSVSRN